MGAAILFFLSHIQVWAVAVIAYFCGCFNGAVIVSKYLLRDDVRNHGSGNAGLTNFYRTFGGPLTFVVLLTDVFKAVLAVAVAGKFGELYDPRMMADLPLDASTGAYYVVLFQYWSVLFCMLGHMFPVMFGFRGGKGILVGGTAAILIDWRVALIVWGAFLMAVLLTRYVSLGSLCAGALFPVSTWICYAKPAIALLAFLCGALIVWQHRQNVLRLLSGTESKFHFKK